MFNKVIVAADLSQASYALVNQLDGLKDYGVEEMLLLQCMSLQETSSIALSYTTSVVENSLQDQKKALTDKGFNVETRIVMGTAKKEINKIAEEENYSLIVVGAQKDTMAREIFFGGLAYELIHHSRKPVLIIRMEDNSKEGVSKSEYIECIGCDIDGDILFATDFSENAETAFMHLKEMANKGAKKITLMHVQDKAKIKPHLEDKLEEFNKTDEDRLDAMKKSLLDKGDVEVDTLIKLGSPSKEILKTIEELDIKLVVMGSQGRGIVKELFIGSVSHNIARKSNASVLLIPFKETD